MWLMEMFDPYRRWLGIPPEEQPPNHYRLLGVGQFESDADVISSAADRQMAHVRTFQSGPYSAISQRILNELAAARVCLLDPQKKAEYDEQLCRGPGGLRPAPVPPEIAAPPQPPPGGSGPPVSPPPAAPPVASAATASSGQARADTYSPREKAPAWLATVIALVVAIVSLVLLAWVLNGPEPEQPRKPGARYDGGGARGSPTSHLRT